MVSNFNENVEKAVDHENCREEVFLSFLGCEPSISIDCCCFIIRLEVFGFFFENAVGVCHDHIRRVGGTSLNIGVLH